MRHAHAARLEVGREVPAALGKVFERWDGRGWPNKIRGDALDEAVGIVNVAGDADLFHSLGGIEAAREALKARRGKADNPRLVDVFCREAAELFDGVDESATRAAVAQMVPDAGPALVGDRLASALTAFADFADLESVFTAGHSRRVSSFAAGAAQRMGMGSEGNAIARPQTARRTPGTRSHRQPRSKASSFSSSPAGS